MNKIDDDAIKNHLKNMPEIKDHLSKEEWIEKIQPYTYERKRVRRKQSKMIPIFSTILLIGIMILIIPSIIKGPASINNQSLSSQFDGEQRMLSDENRDEQVGSTSIESHQGQDEVGEFVLYGLEEGEQLVFGGIFDQQVQYIIPLAFISSTDQSLSEAYSKLDSYIAPFDSSSRVPYFEEMKFEIDLEEQTVVMHMNDSYTIGEGTAIQGKFEEMLSIIFQPYGIKEVLIQSDEGTPFILGEIGEVTSISIQDSPNENFKYYYDDAHEYGFLVPIKQNDRTFEQAIEDLKEKDEDFSIQPTIPASIEYTLDCEPNHDCSIEFTDEINQLSDSEQVLAIESILMTAKSYGYEQIFFKGIDKETIAGYDLSIPIEVPLAVNPVHVD